jgi:hypothetical protein
MFVDVDSANVKDQKAFRGRVIAEVRPGRF